MLRPSQSLDIVDNRTPSGLPGGRGLPGPPGPRRPGFGPGVGPGRAATGRTTLLSRYDREAAGPAAGSAAASPADPSALAKADLPPDSRGPPESRPLRKETRRLPAPAGRHRRPTCLQMVADRPPDRRRAHLRRARLGPGPQPLRPAGRAGHPDGGLAPADDRHPNACRSPRPGRPWARKATTEVRSSPAFRTSSAISSIPNSRIPATSRRTGRISSLNSSPATWPASFAIS